MQQDCIFCAIVARKAPATIVDETDDILVIKDIYPKTPIHYLIIPKHHYKDLQELNDCCVGGRLLQMAKKISQKSGMPDYRLLINNGPEVGQRVFHLHMHFLAGKRFTDF